MRSTRGVLRLLSSALIVLFVAVGLAVMLTRRGGPAFLTAGGLDNLKYFTADSNLLLGLVCLAELILSLAGVTEKSAALRLWTDCLIYTATVAVSLTFTVAGVFFGPFVGYVPLYRDANLYFHLVVPVLAILSFCLLRRERTIPLRETFFAMIPAVIYGLYYTAVLLVRGVRFPETDWYGFAAGGVVGSVLVAAGIMLLTWSLALLLRLAAGRTMRAARRRTDTEIQNG